MAGITTACLALFLFAAESLPENPILQSLGIKKPIIVGFLPYWLLNRADTNSLQQLNRITYFGLEPYSDGTLVEQSAPQETEPGWNNLKNGKFREKIQTIPKGSSDYSLLIHQSKESSISALMSNPTLHATNLVSAVEPIMREHGFTDLNLDIESFSIATPGAQASMTAFVREVKDQLTEKELGTLTVELTVASLNKNHLQDPLEIGKIADHVVLMAYDYRYTGSFISGAVAPIGGAKEKIGYDIPESLRLATAAIPSKKILLGIPLYGYEWESLSYQPESAVIPGTGKTATISRVAELKKNCTDCVQGRDELTGSPYLILPPNEESAIQQIYYEDAQSIQQKLDLANQYELGGVAFWAMGYEEAGLLDPLKTYKNHFSLK